MPWAALVALIAPHMPAGLRGRPPFPVQAMLRTHFMQQWFTLSGPAMEEALHDVPLLRDFAGLGGWDDRLPDETTILRFRQLLEKHGLAPRILETVNDVLRAQGPDAARGHRRRRHADRSTEFDREPLGPARPGDEAEQEGQPVVLRHGGHIGVDAALCSAPNCPLDRRCTDLTNRSG